MSRIRLQRMPYLSALPSAMAATCALAAHGEQLPVVTRRPCSVVGVPKSIDNDILLIDKTFG